MGKKLEKLLDSIREDPTQFVFHASDEYHHGTSLRIKVGEDLLRLVEEVVSSRRFPYRTESDVVRDALFHRLSELHHLVEEEGRGWGGPLQAVKRIHLVNAMASIRAEATKWMEDLEKNMSSSKTSERQRQKLVSDVWDALQSMDDSEEEKEIWIKHIRDRYGAYIPEFSFGRRID